MVLLISYDLDHHARPSQYAAVEKMLKENSTSWAKPLYSQWFIETNESADTWSNRMKTVTDSNDYWLIVPVKRPYQGWLKQEVWNWLNARI
jgi:hypothetical protein